MPIPFDPLRLVILAFLNPSDSMMFLRVAYDECLTFDPRPRITIRSRPNLCVHFTQ